MLRRMSVGPQYAGVIAARNADYQVFQSKRNRPGLGVRYDPGASRRPQTDLKCATARRESNSPAAVWSWTAPVGADHWAAPVEPVGLTQVIPPGPVEHVGAVAQQPWTARCRRRRNRPFEVDCTEGHRTRTLVWLAPGAFAIVPPQLSIPFGAPPRCDRSACSHFVTSCWR